MVERCSFRKGKYYSACWFCDKQAEGILDCDFPGKNYEVFSCKKCAKQHGRYITRNNEKEGQTAKIPANSFVESQQTLNFEAGKCK